MFDFTTIITLLAPALCAPIVVLILMRVLDRSEAAAQIVAERLTGAARLSEDLAAPVAESAEPLVEREPINEREPVGARQAA